jgi:hypothetical protein
VYREVIASTGKCGEDEGMAGRCCTVLYLLLGGEGVVRLGMWIVCFVLVWFLVFGFWFLVLFFGGKYR